MRTCIECGKPADAPKEQQSEKYPICKICLSNGWTCEQYEMFKALEEDDGFQLGITSPVQRHDLIQKDV